MGTKHDATSPFFTNDLTHKTMIVFIVGLILGAYLDNRFAPKIRVVDGKVTFEWSDKKKKP